LGSLTENSHLCAAKHSLRAGWVGWGVLPFCSLEQGLPKLGEGRQTGNAPWGSEHVTAQVHPKRGRGLQGFQLDIFHHKFASVEAKKKCTSNLW